METSRRNRSTSGMLLVDGMSQFHMRLQRLDCIEQEHTRIFRDFLKTFYADNTVISSLVFGDNFIHSYNLNLARGFLLSVQTYSRHGNSCYCEAYMDPELNVDTAMSNYLRVSRASWFTAFNTH